jgi:hypothetical protein
MALLTVTPAAKRAIDEYCRASEELGEETRTTLESTVIDSPIDHHQLFDISRYLVKHSAKSSGVGKGWRLETLLKGAAVYQPPPPSKPEPVSSDQQS